MKKLTIFGFLVLSLSAHADFVVKDWKSSGDGLITLDTDSGLEWLDLSYTSSKTPKDGLSNVYRRTQDEVELGYEGLAYDLIGWRVANRQEVEDLLHHAFPQLPKPLDSFKILSSSNIEFTQKQTFGTFLGAEKYPSGIVKDVFGAYCENTMSSPSDSNNPCWATGVIGNNINGTGKPRWRQPVQNSNVPIWVVRGESLPPVDACPIYNTELTRQQAIDYISHLSNQLSDPNTTVITTLNF